MVTVMRAMHGNQKHDMNRGVVMLRNAAAFRPTSIELTTLGSLRNNYWCKRSISGSTHTFGRPPMDDDNDEDYLLLYLPLQVLHRSHY